VLPTTPPPPPGPQIVTVTGAIPPESLGVTLAHEHVLVDFIGAAEVSRDRYDPEEVYAVALPHLQEVASRGCRSLVECTPAYLGRDPLLLKRLSEASGLQIVTNTGYYGARAGKFLPPHAHTETPDELAARWTAEFVNGIEDTGVRPGFLKLAVDKGPLSLVDRKLVTAAARCHLQTGLVIYVHTGDGAAAQGIATTLAAEGVSPAAYVWVHAQNEQDRRVHAALAEQRATVAFDGVGPEAALELHVEAVVDMAARGHLPRLLVSQDAGWYHVGEPGGGRFRSYVYLFDEFLPALRERGVREAQIRALLVDNPARALTLKVLRA
jgi:phosphotriesterase-related protein